MKDSDIKALISDLRTVAQQYFNNTLVTPPNYGKMGLCYYIDAITTYDYEDYKDHENCIYSVYGVMANLMESLGFNSMYFGGRHCREPFKQRAYMALILAEYLEQEQS